MDKKIKIAVICKSFEVFKIFVRYVNIPPENFNLSVGKATSDTIIYYWVSNDFGLTSMLFHGIIELDQLNNELTEMVKKRISK